MMTEIGLMSDPIRFCLRRDASHALPHTATFPLCLSFLLHHHAHAHAHTTPVDWLLDRLQTALNVTGDCVVSGIIAHTCPLEDETVDSEDPEKVIDPTAQTVHHGDKSHGDSGSGSDDVY